MYFHKQNDQYNKYFYSKSSNIIRKYIYIIRERTKVLISDAKTLNELNKVIYIIITVIILRTRWRNQNFCRLKVNEQFSFVKLDNVYRFSM